MISHGPVGRRRATHEPQQARTIRHHWPLPAIIVSNNSSYAILEYLAIHRIGPVAGVVGRDDSDPELMKPSPYLVRAAVGILDAHPAECAFVGDSTTDMLAGRLQACPSSAMRTSPARPNS